LGGSLVNYLNNVAGPLPRMITFNIATTYGALSLSQLIYYVGNRSDEIIAENKIVHPAFCPESHSRVGIMTDVRIKQTTIASAVAQQWIVHHRCRHA
jgi:hypothetical protein